ncbi:MAG: hypothetical protein ACM3N9_07270 [Syntrophothermus sp.]
MKYGYILIILFSLSLLSCSKKEDTTPSATGLTFEKLVASDTVMAVNGLTTLTATASGQGLNYEWASEYGTFIGSGNTVQWTVCHADRFRITCSVTDKSNNISKKEIYIRTYEP